MKQIEVHDGRILTIEPTLTALKYQPGSKMIICNTAGPNPDWLNLFCPFDVEETICRSLGFEPPCGIDDLVDFMMELAMSRLSARLAADHVQLIHNDHYEAAICVLLEQQECLRTLDTLTPEYVQDWRQVVANRVTGSCFAHVSAENSWQLRRSHREHPRMAITDTAGVHCGVSLTDGAVPHEVRVPVYVGCQSACVAALRFFEAYPWQETVTSIQLERWVARHAVDRSPRPSPQPPTRAITLPAEPRSIQHTGQPIR